MKPFHLAKSRLQFVPAAIILLGFGIFTEITAQTITTFDAPGAGTGPGQGTQSFAINKPSRLSEGG